ncbi:hypothetical protein JTB14_015723 [Gonioctena quinquepunctata]|nr:hypothetical protein JTB14_015723 [Gonioctena quinquepunctata]
MEKVFKCCKKNFNNLCCITCYDIFHLSCLDRRSDYKELGGYKIYCSTKCEEKDQKNKRNEENNLKEIRKLKNDIIQRDEFMNKLGYEKEDKLNELQKKIHVLEREMKEKDAAYKREKRKTLDFEHDVIETDQKLAIILKEDITELNLLSRNMVSTIATLEAEYNECVQSAKLFRMELEKREHISLKIEEKGIVDIHGSEIKPNKILFIAGSHGRHLVNLLPSKLPHSYQFLSILKPYATDNEQNPDNWIAPIYSIAIRSAGSITSILKSPTTMTFPFLLIYKLYHIYTWWSVDPPHF